MTRNVIKCGNYFLKNLNIQFLAYVSYVVTDLQVTFDVWAASVNHKHAQLGLTYQNSASVKTMRKIDTIENWGIDLLVKGSCNPIILHSEGANMADKVKPWISLVG